MNKLNASGHSKESRIALGRLANFLKEEAVDDAIEKQYDVTGEQFSKGIINYMVVEVREEPFSRMQRLHNAVVTEILNRKGFVSDIISSITIATFGFPFEDPATGLESCEEAVNFLLKQLDDQIKILYGSEEGQFGNQGAESCHHYGPIISQFSKKLSLLADLEYGGKIKI